MYGPLRKWQLWNASLEGVVDVSPDDRPRRHRRRRRRAEDAPPDEVAGHRLRGKQRRRNIPGLGSHVSVASCQCSTHFRSTSKGPQAVMNIGIM